MTLPSSSDFVVVGSGAAALTGAYTAARLGLDVVVLEKTSLLGGTSAYSGACLWVPGNPVLLAAQRAAGEPLDSVEAGLEFLRHTVGAQSSWERQETYVRTGPELVEFLTQDDNLVFQRLQFPDYYDVPGRARPCGRGINPAPLAVAAAGRWRDRIRPPVAEDQAQRSTDDTDDRNAARSLVARPSEDLMAGQALIARLLLAIEATGRVTIVTGAAMTSLVVDDNRVVGVEVRHEERSHSIWSSAGVLLGAGGFERDEQRRRTLHDLPSGTWSSSAPGTNEGDALSALEAIGVPTELMDEAWWCPATLLPQGYAAFTLGIHGGIIVNDLGERFTNEAAPYDQVGHAMLTEIKEGRAARGFWWIFPQAEAIPGIASAQPLRHEMVPAGLWLEAPSAEELGIQMGLKSGVLAATLRRFDEGADAGTDEYHRGRDDFDQHFAGASDASSCLAPIGQALLSAVRLVLGDLGTKGGARTDVDARAMSADDAPVPGLYVVGNSAASVAGHVYPGPGVPLGSGMVFAYRAARHASRLHRPADAAHRYA